MSNLSTRQSTIFGSKGTRMQKGASDAAVQSIQGPEVKTMVLRADPTSLLCKLRAGEGIGQDLNHN